MERHGASTLGRVISCALLVVGIAVMHHVVVTGCSTVAGDSSHGHSAHMPDQSTAAMPSEDGLGEVPPADAPAAAICLAVMLGGWVLVPLVRAWRVRRDAEPSALALDPAVVDVPPHPPDLVLLSVSRT